MATAAHPDAVPFYPPQTTGNLPRIAFCGLGNLGIKMAENLASHKGTPEAPILLWNRTISKAEGLANVVGKDKAIIAQSLRQVVEDSDIIITNLANDAAVKDVYLQFSDALKMQPPTQTKIFVETSTIYPTLAGDLDKMISSHEHARIITSPVWGTPAVAEKAQLLIVMSGDYASKREVAHILVPAVGRKVLDLGGNLEKAPTFKLIGNSTIIGTIEIMSEAFTLADKAGIGSENVLDFVKEMMPAPGIVRYASRMAHDDFDATLGFVLEGGIKDATLMRRLSAEYNSPMPTIDIAHQHFITARSLNSLPSRQGKPPIETLDLSALVAGTRVAAGLEPFKQEE